VAGGRVGLEQAARNHPQNKRPSPTKMRFIAASWWIASGRATCFLWAHE
jgi:hypothetical protein